MRALRTRAISANITAMSDDFDQRLMTGGSQVAVGMATANPLKFGEGLLTILGLETQNSATQKAVVIDFESFLGEELDTRRAESADHKRRLDNFEQRLATLSWLAEEFGTRLGERGARHSDLIALLTAGFEVWRSTADAKKRKLLGNALRNAFDPQQYEEGLTLRLLSILVELTYGEIFVLRQQKELLEKWPRVGPGVFKVSNHDLQRAHSNSSEVPLRASDLAKGSLVDDHINRLVEHRLIVVRPFGWELDGRQVGSSLEVNTLTELGERLLKLVADRESTSPEP